MTLRTGSRGMQIQRCRPGALCSQRADVAIVMDVLRMTSTAAALMHRSSCPSVGLAATLGDLARLPRPFLIVSELLEASRRGARIDNSPAQVSRVELGERTPVLVTTNGTKTVLAAAQCAPRVLLASFIDLHAVARHIAATASVLLVPAGSIASGRACIEDDLCADALESLLTGTEPDLEASAAIIRADPRVRARVEAEPGFSADLDVALRVEPRATVLEFQALDGGVGKIIRAPSAHPGRS